jgi:hypothetical protein
MLTGYQWYRRSYGWMKRDPWACCWTRMNEWFDRVSLCSLEQVLDESVVEKEWV